MCYHRFVATIVIRKLDESVKRRLQIRAALNGRSMEAEVRLILHESLHNPLAASDIPSLDRGLGTAIHELFASLGGVELSIPPRRKSHRPIPDFS